MRLFKRLATILLLGSAIACGFALTPARAQEAPAVTQPVAPSWEVIDDDWMIIEIGGGRVGWINTRTEKHDSQIRTATITKITVNRGDAPIEVRIETTFIETADGEPVSMSMLQDFSLQSTTTRWDFHGDRVKETIMTGGTERTQDKSAPEGEWMTPHEVEEYSREKRKEGATEITVRTVSPEVGLQAMEVTSTRTGETEHEIDGKPAKVSVWKTTGDAMPETTEYYDADGESVFMQIAAPGLGNMTMRAASKAEAMTPIEGGGLEMLARTFVTPDKPIHDVMKATKATLKITAREGTLSDLPTAASQRVEMSEDRKSAVLTIDIANPVAATQEEQSNDEYTRPSMMVDYEDELVSKLSNRAADDEDALAKAQTLRKLAYKRIGKKGMSTVFASASETAKMQTGDCSEHGVLLAALLRAQHIPSRVAMGLVYVDEFMDGQNIFGWHMWTQALIDGKWVDLDATLPVRYHAGHVLTNTSSLAEGMGAADMLSIVQLIGNIDIEVVNVEHASE